MTNSARLSGRPSSSAAYNVGDVVDTPDSAIKSWRYLGAGEWEPNDAVRYTTGPGGEVEILPEAVRAAIAALGGGGPAGVDIMIASSDAPDDVKASAHFVCGGSDDQLTINAAIAMLIGGGVVKLSAGHFNVSDSVVVASDVTLSGAGWATRIVAAPTFAANATAVPTGIISTQIPSGVPMKAVVRTPGAAQATVGVAVENLHIDGRSAEQTTQTGHMTGLLLQNTSRARAQNVLATDFLVDSRALLNSSRSFCIATTDVNHVQIINCHGYRAGYECLAIRDGSTRVQVLGGLYRTSANTWHAIQAATVSPMLTLIMGVSMDCAEGGAAFTSHGASEISLIGNAMGGELKLFAGASRVMAIGNYIKPAGRIGVSIDGASDVLIANNVIDPQALGGARGAVEFLQDHGVNDNVDITLANNTILAKDWNNSISVKLTTRTLTGLRVYGNKLSSQRGVLINGSVTDVLFQNNTHLNNQSYSVTIDGVEVGKCRFIGETFRAPPAQIFRSQNGADLSIHTVRGCIGLVTEASGTATVPSGSTSVTVTHGLGSTPRIQDIRVTPTNNLGAAAKFWISAAGATTFVINVDADPGATTATFAWSHERLV